MVDTVADGAGFGQGRLYVSRWLRGRGRRLLSPQRHCEQNHEDASLKSRHNLMLQDVELPGAGIKLRGRQSGSGDSGELMQAAKKWPPPCGRDHNAAKQWYLANATSPYLGWHTSISATPFGLTRLCEITP